MRIKIVIGLLFFVLISLLSRVFYLSIHSNDYYENLAEQNTVRTEFVAPVRGEILDRNFQPLAINKLGFKIELEPHLRQDEKALEALIDNIARLLPFMQRERMLKRYISADSHYNHRRIAISDFVPYEEVLPVYTRLMLMQNVYVTLAPQRYYPFGSVASHLIGYTAKANQKEIDRDETLALTGIIGKTGLERQYNGYLQGEPGKRVVTMNALNQEVAEINASQPVQNRNLVLNIDILLQRYIGELMRGKAGSVVVMKTDGAVLAASSYPEYDPNTFVSGISHKAWNALINNLDKPFTNKIVNGLYPPGSVIKPSLGLIYLDNGVSRWWRTDCNGTIRLGKRKFRCWKSHGHGMTDLNKAIRESCDIYFYEGSLKVGIAKMSEGLKRFGLGKKTGIDLPNEFIGTIPNREWKRQHYHEPWYIGETLNASIGQGNMLVTPMQIAQNTALMATGKLPVPRVARMIDNNLTLPVYEADVLSSKQKAYLPVVRKAMEEVCNDPHGTAAAHIHSKIHIAGKTGTAQVVGISQETKKRLKEHEMAYYTRSHAWLTTFGPYENPQVVITVFVEHGGHGGTAAGTTVSKIYDKLFELGYITP